MLEELLKAPFWIDIENWPLSWEIGGTSWFPFLESIHVIAAALLVGAIATIDLRLLGVGAVRYPLSTLGREILPWVWGCIYDRDHHRARHVYYPRRLSRC